MACVHTERHGLALSLAVGTLAIRIGAGVYPVMVRQLRLEVLQKVRTFIEVAHTACRRVRAHKYNLVLDDAGWTHKAQRIRIGNIHNTILERRLAPSAVIHIRILVRRLCVRRL